MRVLRAALLVSLVVPTASLALPGPTDDVGTRHDLIPPTSGTFLLGLVGVMVHDPDGSDNPVYDVPPVSARTWETAPPGCDRRLFLDLDYAPQNLTGEPSSPVELGYTFRIIVRQGTFERDRLVATPVEGLFVATVPDDEPVHVDLVLLTGADVDWTLRIEGRQDFAAPRCAPDPL